MPDTDADGPPSILKTNYVVKKGFQTKIVVWTVGFSLFASGIVLADYYYYFGRSISSNVMDPSLFLEGNEVLLIKLIVFFGILVVGTVVYSHKVAGPLYSLERTIRAVAAGNISQRAKFRHGDELEDLKQEFNQMMDSLQARVAKDRRLAEALSQRLGLLLDGEKNLPASVRQALEQARTELGQVTKDLTF